MNRPSENNLNIFASLVLGGAGVVILLLPNHPATGVGGATWGYVLLGSLFFLTSLLLQIISIVDVPEKQARAVRIISVLLLAACAFLYIHNGYAVEGVVFLATGVAQLALLLFGSNRFEHIDPTNLAIAFSSFPAGIYLAVANFSQLPPGQIQWALYLAAAFFVTGFISTSANVAPPFRYRKILIHLQALPWPVWAVIFLPSEYGANLIVPLAVIATSLLKHFIPWGLLRVWRNDVLTRRVLATAFTIELTLAIFLSALLLFLDQIRTTGAPMFTAAREAVFVFFTVISLVIVYQVGTIIMTINGLMQELTGDDDTAANDEYSDIWHQTIWSTRLAKYIKPFIAPNNIRTQVTAQKDQIRTLARQVMTEKKRNAQLTLLMELSQQLENQLDQPVAAQLAVNTLERALNCSLAMVFLHEPESKEFTLLAAAGRQINLLPAGYRQSASKGVIGRAHRQRKTQIVNDTRQDPDYEHFENEKSLSVLVIPLISNGHVNGAIWLTSEQTFGFSSIDIGLAEAAAAELTRAWERSGYQQRLTELIQAGSQLSAMVEPGNTAQEVALIARQILNARFTYVHIQLGQERNFIQSASSGTAPNLLESLRTSMNSETLINTAFQATQPFRVRDVRKYQMTSHLAIDSAGLRSLLATPIRWHHMNIGVILAFGKQNEVFFSENDESLAELLSIQTAGAFESTWLQQELRSSLRITSLLYRLSNQIIQAENLEDAASDIAKTAHKLARNTVTGIVLFAPDDNIAAEAAIDSSGSRNDIEHPMQLVRDAMESGQLIYVSQGKAEIRTCLPIQTPIRKYGAIWMVAPDEPGRTPATNPNDLQALVNQAAIALERSLLLVESRRQAEEIKTAYNMLESTYDQTLASLISALDARDRETEGHSLRVSQLAVKLGETLGFSQEQLKVLERGSLLHDIGKIGVSDNILHKPGPLNEGEWKIMRQHPDIGAKIVEGIPFLEDTIPLIRHHQERWDGSGYPDRLAGQEIPLLARLFAVVDAFDALTSNRPYRKKTSEQEALEYIRENAEILFDPKITAAFEQLIQAENDLNIKP